MAWHGGVARDGYYGLGMGRRKLLRDGIAGSAVVTSFYEMEDASTMGNAQHDFTLEVRLDGRAPYEVQGLFKIPAKLVGSVGPGEVVPVRVHPSEPERVAIDWDGWEPNGLGAGIDLDESLGSANLASLDMDAVRRQVRQSMTPDAHKMMIDGLMMARKAGQLSDAQLEQTLAGALQSGLLTEEEADEVRGAG